MRHFHFIRNDFRIYYVHIGLTQQTDKLVFIALKENCHCETSAHTGRGNPPTIPGGLLGRLSVFLGFLKIRGIATSLRSSQ